MRRPLLLFIAICGSAALTAGQPTAAEPDTSTAEPAFIEAPPPIDDELGYAMSPHAVPSKGTINALVIFAQFKDERSRGEKIPPWAADLFDSERTDSFSSFYRTMSFGQFQVLGTVLPKRYTSRWAKKTYCASNSGDYGDYDIFVEQILTQVDADYDLGQFDNDGPDGVPNSGDDDGRVDFVFVVMRSVPPNFLLGNAEGIAGLLMTYTSSEDISASTGEGIYVGDKKYHGNILEQRNQFDMTVGIMAHEFGHALGLVDLYDLPPYTPHRDDSAGIGCWGLMGRGTNGWDGASGPNPFCAWSLEQLGWIGVDNEQLVEVRGDSTDLTVAGIHDGGQVYKIPIGNGNSRDPNAYVLLAQRTPLGPYDEGLPGEGGLLIWQVQPGKSLNYDEEDKLVDLVCADGLYHSSGMQGDHLDFWAHNAAYTKKNAGNEGDSTDPFDGRQFSALSSVLPGLEGTSGLIIDSIRRQGEAMVVDVRQPRWSGRIETTVKWKGEVFVGGDLTITENGKLEVDSTASVRFDSTDGLRTGLDPERIELHVYGGLKVASRRSQRNRTPEPTPYDPALFEQYSKGLSAEPQRAQFEAEHSGASWLGIIMRDRGWHTIKESNSELRDAVYGHPVKFDELQGVSSAKVASGEPVDAMDEPLSFALLPNYPNPFISETTLRYSLAAPSDVRLRVFNVLGQPVRELVAEHLFEGEHEVVWRGEDEDGRQLASGFYVSHLEIPGTFTAQDKMMFMPSGYSRVASLDQELRANDVEWGVLGDDVYGAGEVSFSYTPSTNGAAYEAGGVWVRLQVATLYSVDTPRVAALANRLGQLASALDPSDDGGESLVSALDPLRAGALTAAVLSRARDRLDLMLRDQQTVASLYFYVGEWLESLAMASRAAHQLSVPLDHLADPAVDASVARQFKVSLSALEADEILLTDLERLAAMLETPSTDLASLVELLEEMTETE